MSARSAPPSRKAVRKPAPIGESVAPRSLRDVGRDLAVGELVRILSDFEGSTDVGIDAAHPRAPHILPPVTAVIAFLRNLSTDAGMVDANDCPRIGAMIGYLNAFRRHCSDSVRFGGR